MSTHWRDGLLRLNRWRSAVFLTLLLLFAGGAIGAKRVAPKEPVPSFNQAEVTRVVDGDTVWVKPVNQTADKPYWRIRIHGIDAPESCQSHGVAATTALRQKIEGRTVEVMWLSQDVYGRWLARLHDVQTQSEVGAWMVMSGHAWSYQYKGDPGPYAGEEARARAGRLGLFVDDRALRPSQFRRLNGPCSKR
jgi:micrococcal nuclease